MTYLICLLLAGGLTDEALYFCSLSEGEEIRQLFILVTVVAARSQFLGRGQESYFYALFFLHFSSSALYNLSLFYSTLVKK